MSANKNTRNNDTNVTSQSMDNTVAGIESTYINPRHLTARRQAVKWDAETDRKLLLVGLGREIRPAEFEVSSQSNINISVLNRPPLDDRCLPQWKVIPVLWACSRYLRDDLSSVRTASSEAHLSVGRLLRTLAHDYTV